MTISFFTQTCDIKKYEPVSTTGAQVSYSIVDVHANVKCRYDPRRVRSDERSGEITKAGLEMVTFFTEYRDNPRVTNDMIVVFRDEVYNIEYVNDMIQGTQGHHLEIVCNIARNI